MSNVIEIKQNDQDISEQIDALLETVKFIRGRRGIADTATFLAQALGYVIGAFCIEEHLELALTDAAKAIGYTALQAASQKTFSEKAFDHAKAQYPDAVRTVQ